MIQKLGKYTIVEKLGEGAMGAVYKAYDEVLDRYVAVKTMAEDIKWDPELKLRFYREARSAASLHHPNIVTIHDLGEDGKITYIVMELLQGEDLKSIIKNQSPLPLEKKLSIIAQVADGLNHAHLSGIIHRDVKPGNIHVSPSGNVKIVDFGIARIPSSDLTRSGARLGTPIYMSPEQIRGSEYDERSDIFSTGIVFYELVTYQHPFRDKNIAKTLDNILFQNRFPFSDEFPDAPPRLWDIINTCLAKEANQRYGSMAELAKACRELVADLNSESQRMLKQVQASLPRMRQTVMEGRGSPRLVQALQQAETLMKQEDKSDYCGLRRITAVLAEEPPSADTVSVSPGKIAPADLPADAIPSFTKEAPAQPPRPKAFDEAARPQPPPPSAPDELRGRELLQAGKALLKESRLDEALEQLRRAMNLLGPREEVVQALVEVRKLIEERKSERSSQLSTAVRQALSAKEFQRALDTVNEIIGAEPNNAEALELRRKVLSEIEAEKERQKHKEEGEREKALGFRLVAEQKYREARRPLERARTLLGDDPEVKQALDRATEAVRAEDLRERARTELARAGELLKSGNPDRARGHVRFVLDLAPDHPEANQLLAAIDQAEAEKRKATEIASRLSKAQDALRRQDFDSACAHGNEALRLDPENHKTRELLQEIERVREAKRKLDEIQSLRSQSRDELRRQNFDAAADRAHDVLNLDPQNPEALELLRMIEQGREAKRKLDEINSLLSRSREALDRENLVEAKSLAERALALDPGHANTRELLQHVSSAQADKRKQEDLASLLSKGQLAFLRDDFAEAERCAREMLRLDPQHAKGGDLLARIDTARAKRRQEDISRRLAGARDALRSGDFDRARAYGRELQNLDPENVETRQLFVEISQTEEKLKQEKLSRLLDRSRQALGSQDFDLAARLAEEALGLDAKSRASKSLIKEIKKERAKQERLSVKEAKLREKERKLEEQPVEPEETAVLDRLDKTVVLARQRGIRIPGWVLWASVGVASLAVIAVGIYWAIHSVQPTEDIAAQIATARAALSEKRFDQALEIAGRILASHPDSSEAQALRDEAARSKKQDSINSLLMEAQSLKAQGQLEESLRSVEKILQMDPTNQAALAVQAEVQQLMTPTTPSAPDQVARIKQWVANAQKFLAADKTAEAKAEIDKIARAAPAAPELAQLRKLLAAKSADLTQKQREALETAQRQSKLAEFGKHAGELFRSGKYSEAQGVIDQWLGLAPQDSNAISLRQQNSQALQSRRAIDTHLEQKRYDEALKAMAQLEKINPADPAIAELRKRAENEKAAARATLSILRLGSPATILLDNQPVGRDGEVSNLSIPVGTHRITVRNAQGRQFDKVTEFYEGQSIPLVYEAAGPTLREMVESDRELLNNRRIREEVHGYEVEHRHLFGHCTGTLFISGLRVEYKGSDASHSFARPFEDLRVSVRDDRVDLETKDNKRNWGFKAKNPAQAAQIKALWERLLQVNK
jgi:serine/threonine protein kinase/Tfp pilus assembly protein PilF